LSVEFTIALSSNQGVGILAGLADIWCFQTAHGTIFVSAWKHIVETIVVEAWFRSLLLDANIICLIIERGWRALTFAIYHGECIDTARANLVRCAGCTVLGTVRALFSLSIYVLVRSALTSAIDNGIGVLTSQGVTISILASKSVGKAVLALVRPIDELVFCTVACSVVVSLSRQNESVSTFRTFRLT